jgi:biotin carboxyl carrier protein
VKNATSRYQINVNGQQYDVEIEDLHASPVRVKVNGQPFEVSVAAPNKARPQAQTQPFGQSDLEMDAYVPAVTTTYQEIDVDETASTDGPSAAAAQTAVEGATPVSAPMPGTILDIVVEVGDAVAQGDTLCNLEAMKMKSPIRSPGQGTIAQVLIAEGQNVGYGDVLFTLNA